MSKLSNINRGLILACLLMLKGCRSELERRAQILKECDQLFPKHRHAQETCYNMRKDSGK